MQLKEPLALVLVGQMVVLAGAVGFLVAKGGAAPEAPARSSHTQAHPDDADPDPKPADAHADPLAHHDQGAAHPHGEAPPTVAHRDEATPHRHEAPAAVGAPSAPEVKPKVERPTFEEVIDSLVAGNARFVDGTSRQRDGVARRQAVAAEDTADAVVVTCSDSRVSPELLFDQPLGALEVLRLPGAQLDDGASKAVGEAVKRLHAKAVLVMGHVGCHHVEHALALASRKTNPKASSLSAALGGLKATLEGQSLENGAAIAATSFATRELRRRLKLTGRPNEVAVLRLLYDPRHGAVRWLDAEQESAPVASAPHAGRP
jgi:carbonic anhydrase